MFAQFYEVRAGLRSSRTSTPQPEALKEEVFTGDSRKAKSGLENRNAFVVDVCNYLNRIPWYDAVMILGRIVEPGRKKMSWRRIARFIKKESSNRKCPARLGYYQHLNERYKSVVRPDADHYFREIGYLR
jgi:hypothetical protein